MRHESAMIWDPILVDFPLRGEWVAYHTPAERILSHGVDMLGQRYAYDFFRIEATHKGFKFFLGSTLRYLLFGVRLEDCYGFAAQIHAPFDGTVIAAQDGWLERKRLHFLRDLAVVVKNSLVFDPAKVTDLRPVLGNHVILKMDGREVYGFFAHARCGSVLAHEGEQVRVGDQIAEVGHSGNSTAPHLHFQLMDRATIVDAQGLPCGFNAYEVLRDGVWKAVSEGTLGKREFIRYAT
ncbi:MAG: M23 family metallopeptidase [Dehalococcoidia bacterium]|nr:M23 family metallopeptidase [Dehalococcoidia bacterium]